MTTPAAAQPTILQQAPADMSAQILIELGKLSTQIAVMDEKLKDLPDHEHRIRLLESAKAKLYGGVFAVSVLVSAAGTWVGALITHH